MLRPLCIVLIVITGVGAMGRGPSRGHLLSRLLTPLAVSPSSEIASEGLPSRFQYGTTQFIPPFQDTIFTYLADNKAVLLPFHGSRLA